MDLRTWNSVFLHYGFSTFIEVRLKEYFDHVQILHTAITDDMLPYTEMTQHYMY